MNARPRLELVRMVAFSGEADADVAEDLEYLLSVEYVSIDDTAHDGEDAVEVLFKLSYKLFDPEDEEDEEDEEDDGSVMSVSAAYRLVYSRPPEDRTERAELATRRALADVWPLFLPWLHGRMAEFGLSPTELSPRPPRELVKEAEQALERAEEEA